MNRTQAQAAAVPNLTTLPPQDPLTFDQLSFVLDQMCVASKAIATQMKNLDPNRPGSTPIIRG